MRTGLGFDVHRFAPGDHVVLCGVKVPYEARLDGHSDADVGLHALTDAILGALAAGDIGSHFPPSDPQWRGADSALFLRHAVGMVAERGGVISHVDVTLICERPKIGPHREAMVARMGELLNLASDRVSVKATTTERLGFTGRGKASRRRPSPRSGCRQARKLRLGPKLKEEPPMFPEDVLEQARDVLARFSAAGCKVATAESCTGG